MARWSAHHRKKAIFGWLAIAVALFAVSIVSPLKQIVFETSGPGESGRADTILVRGLQAAGRRERARPATDADGRRPGVPGRRKRSSSGVLQGSTKSRRRRRRSPRKLGQISSDKHSAFVAFEIPGTSDKAVDIIDPVVDRVDELQTAHPGYYIGSFGTSTGKAVEAGFFDDLKKAGEFSVPLR